MRDKIRSRLVVSIVSVTAMMLIGSRAYAVPGMGAIPYNGGVTFRVWAGSAKAVSVEVSSDQGTISTTPLTHEGNGYWTADVATANVGHTYKFILSSPSGETLRRNDPYARSLIWKDNERKSVIVDTSYNWAPYTPPTGNEYIIYEMAVKTFGGYRGVIDKLDYLKDNLAVNAIELLPVHQNTTPGGGWGYNPSGLFAPHVDYGTYKDFKDMVNEAHKRGIAVIVDVVYNHIEGDILWKFDGWTSGTATCLLPHWNGQPWTGEHGGIYYYDWQAVFGRGWNWWHTSWGHNRPDYGRNEVRNFIKDNAVHWLTEMGCDGLRFDSTSNIHHVQDGGGDYIVDGASLLRWINEEARRVKPGSITIAEDLKDNATVTGDWLKFQSQWHASFVHRMRDQIRSLNPDMYVIADVLRWIDNNDVYKLVKYVDSHDEAANGRARLHQEIAGYSNGNPNDATYWSKKKNIIGQAFTVFSAGIPMFLQGDECMTKAYFMDGQDMVKNFNEDYANNVYPGIVRAFRDINRLKLNTYNNTGGLKGSGINVFHVNPLDKVIAFHRWDKGGKGDDVIVVVNLGDKDFPAYDLGAPLDGAWQCRFNSDASTYDSSFGNQGCVTATAVDGKKDNFNYRMTIGIGKASANVYSQ